MSKPQKLTSKMPKFCKEQHLLLAQLPIKSNYDQCKSQKEESLPI